MNQQNLQNRIDEIAHIDDETQALTTIIETPRNGRIKFKYDPKNGLFRAAKFLPLGTVFPYDFGFVPSTIGGDGDPLDVLILMDEPALTGCLVPARLIGVIEAEQTEENKTERNDRLIAVAAFSHIYNKVISIADLSENIVKEIEHFFISYNRIAGREFKPLGRFGPNRADELVKKAADRFQRERKASTSQSEKSTHAAQRH
jgi:inorganic pyrophosphatase